MIDDEIEAMARKICRAKGIDPDFTFGDGDDEPAWRWTQIQNIAKAALAHRLEITDAMVEREAQESHSLRGSIRKWEDETDSYRDTTRAICKRELNAALNPNSGSEPDWDGSGYDPRIDLPRREEDEALSSRVTDEMLKRALVKHGYIRCNISSGEWADRMRAALEAAMLEAALNPEPGDG